MTQRPTALDIVDRIVSPMLSAPPFTVISVFCRVKTDTIASIKPMVTNSDVIKLSLRIFLTNPIMAAVIL